MPAFTTELARRIASSSWESVNEVIGDEAVRALVNWLGCALAGCREAYFEAIPNRDDWTEEGAEATVLAVGDRIDVLAASAITAAGADVLCYTDTHVPTQLSPGAVVGGALLPLAEHRAASGAAFVHAYTLGTELACRTAMALGAPAGPGSPESALCNALGAAGACAKLLGLDTRRTAHALDIACAAIEAEDTRLAGGWPSHAADIAARAGLHAALYARRIDAGDLDADPTSPLESLSARSEVFLDGWGSHWHSGRIAYHAYPCALFLHPAVEACLQLKRTHHLTGRQIGTVDIRMHPSQATLDTGGEPASSAAARSSAQHAAAVALLDGQAGLAQFEAAKLRNARVQEMRARVGMIADAALPDTAAQVTITLASGVTLERLVRCALGHPLRPLGDRELSDKFRGLAGETLATGQAERLLGLAWNVRALPDMGGLIRTTIPEDVYEPAELPGSPLIPR